MVISWVRPFGFGTIATLLAAVSIPAHAGAGWYVGVDSLYDTLDKHSVVDAGAFGTVTDSISDESLDVGARIGYKNRLDHWYLSPEIFVQGFNAGRVDERGVVYGTNVKAGREFGPISTFLNLGYAEFEGLSAGSMLYGIGLEYELSDQFSLTTGWDRFLTVSQMSTDDAGSFTTVTDSDYDIDVFKLGITYYFHE